MTRQPMFKEQLQKWLNYRTWTKTDLAKELEQLQNRNRLRSKVDSWFNKGVYPDRKSFDAVLNALNIDENTFWSGPSWCEVPYSQNLMLFHMNEVIYKGRSFPQPLASPVDTGFVFQEFLSTAHVFLGSNPDVAWHPSLAIGVPLNKLNKSDSLLVLRDVLEICMRTNLDIHDLPCRGGAATKISNVLSDVGWEPFKGGSLLNVLDSHLERHFRSELCVTMKNLRGSWTDMSIDAIEGLSRDQRLKLATKLTELKEQLELALAEGLPEIALSFHNKFHLLLQEKCGIKDVGPLLRKCLETPTRLASTNNHYFLISQEQHGRVIEILSAKSFSRDDYLSWDRTERAVGYSAAILSRRKSIIESTSTSQLT